MWRSLGPVSLSRRIVGSVALGLGVILLLFGLVALWTVQESSDAVQRERLALARAMARQGDSVLGYALVLLERDAADLGVEAGDGPPTPDQLQRLAGRTRHPGLFSHLALVDEQGLVLWVDGPDHDITVGQPVRHPSVAAALSTGQSQISEIPLPGPDPISAICLAVPLRDRYGRLAGALMAEFDPGQAAHNLMPSLDAGDGMHVQVVSETGRLLSSAGHADVRSALEHQQLLADLIAARAAGFRVHRQTWPGQGPGDHVVTYAPLSLQPSWGVMVEAPHDVLLAAPDRLSWRLILVGAGALFLAGGIAWLDVRRVVGPLRQLTIAAERFAAGELDEPVRLERADELGILARAFETMRQRLRTSLAEVAAWNSELERRVAARTAEVEARNRELADLNARAAQLYEQLQRRERERGELLQRVMAAQEEERRRLAQELHDETSQTLASLQLGLERLAAGIEDTEQARRLAAQLRGVAAQSLAGVHRLAVELRPSVLDDVGLVPAIQRYLGDFAQRWGLRVDFAPVGVEHLRLAPAVETAVYRVVQAALTNVAQHAQAQHVNVLLHRREEKLVVVVEDDGRGFDLAAVRGAALEHRLGLAGMEERASLVGATLTIETAPGAGTTVFLELPLAPNRRLEEAHGTLANRAG